MALSNAGRNGPGRRRGADQRRAGTHRAVRTSNCAPATRARASRCRRPTAALYKLSDFRGRQAVVIAWFPRAFTAWMHRGVPIARRERSRVARAGRAVFRGQRGLAGHERGLRAVAEPPVPILSDATRETARAYGVFTSSGFRPADVLHRPRRPDPRHRSPGACVPHGPDVVARLRDSAAHDAARSLPHAVAPEAPGSAVRLAYVAELPLSERELDHRRRARRRGRPRAPRRRREAARPRGAVGHRPRRCGRRGAGRCAEHAARIALDVFEGVGEGEAWRPLSPRGRRQDAGADRENIGRARRSASVRWG